MAIAASGRLLTLDELCVKVQADVELAVEQHQTLESSLDKLIGIVATKSGPPHKVKVERLLSAINRYVDGDFDNAGISAASLHKVSAFGVLMDTYAQSISATPAPPTVIQNVRYNPPTPDVRTELAATLGVVPNPDGYTAEELCAHVFRLKNDLETAVRAKRGPEQTVTFLRGQLQKEKSAASEREAALQRSVRSAEELAQHRREELGEQAFDCNAERSVRMLFTDPIIGLRQMCSLWPVPIAEVGSDIQAMANRGMNTRVPTTVKISDISSQTVIFIMPSSTEAAVSKVAVSKAAVSNTTVSKSAVSETAVNKTAVTAVIKPAIDVLIIADVVEIAWVTTTLLQDLDRRHANGVDCGYLESEWHLLVCACASLVGRMNSLAQDSSYSDILEQRLLLTVARFLEFFVRADLGWCQQSDGPFGSWFESTRNITQSGWPINEIETLILHWVNDTVRGSFKVSLGTLLRSMHLPTVRCDNDLELFVLGEGIWTSIAVLSSRTNELSVWPLAECEPYDAHMVLGVQPSTERWTRRSHRNPQSEGCDPQSEGWGPLIIPFGQDSRRVFDALADFWPRPELDWSIPQRLADFAVGLEE